MLVTPCACTQSLPLWLVAGGPEGTAALEVLSPQSTAQPASPPPPQPAAQSTSPPTSQPPQHPSPPASPQPKPSTPPPTPLAPHPQPALAPPRDPSTQPTPPQPPPSACELVLLCEEGGPLGLTHVLCSCHRCAPLFLLRRHALRALPERVSWCWCCCVRRAPPWASPTCCAAATGARLSSGLCMPLHACLLSHLRLSLLLQGHVHACMPLLLRLHLVLC